MQLFLGAILFFCVAWALFGPLVSPWIEKNLEWFLLGMGLLAVTVSWSWSEAVVVEAIMRPMKVCGAVLLGSLIFSFSHAGLRHYLRKAIEKIGPRISVGAAIIFLGFAAGFITMAVAAITLVELLHAMRLKREAEIHVSVLGCFAISLGGGLTPIGGPVPAIAMANLQGAPFPVPNHYLFQLIGPWVIAAVIAIGIIAGALFAKLDPDRDKQIKEDPLSLWMIMMLTMRLYVFIAGLVFLGAGLVPLISQYIMSASPGLLYWLNTISAVIDGATLASIEINPKMTQNQICYVLIGILIAGGALVTGNAHNVVAAHKLKIPLRAWARVGVPTGIVLMVCCFFSLVIWSN